MKPLNKILLSAALTLGLVAVAPAQNAPAPDAPAPKPTTDSKPADAAATPTPATATPPASSAVSGATNSAPPISSEYGAEGLRVNFHGAPLNLVLDYLSDAAGFIINKQTDVKGTVEVWSKQPVTKEEAIELLSSVLKKNGYGLTRSGRILTIVAMDSVKTADTEIVVNSDPSEVEKSDEVQTQIIPVHYATASQLVANLEQLLPTSATLSANESANTLILVATKTDIKRMLKIVTALDNSMASASSIKVRSLRFADAKETANLITQLFSQQNSGNQQGQGGGGPNAGGPGGGGPGNFRAMMAQMAAGGNRGARGATTPKVVAVADDRSNSVVISAPADLLATIEDMVDKIDKQVTDTAELRVFRLTNADPSEIADQLAQLFPDETNSNGNNQNNVPFFFRGRGGFGQNNNNAAAGESSERMKKMGKVLAVPDPRTSSVIVTASKTLMPQIAEMVAELDSDKGKREVVSYFELQNADPQDVYQNLQDLFNRSTVRMQNNNNQNTFLGRNNPLTQRQTQNQQSTTGNTTSGFGTSGGGNTGGRFGGQ
jgi:type II secretory pathway component GspD/PulD (secretin)